MTIKRHSDRGASPDKAPLVPEGEASAQADVGSEPEQRDPNKGRRLTEDEAHQVQRLMSKGMSPKDARAQVIGKEKPDKTEA